MSKAGLSRRSQKRGIQIILLCEKTINITTLDTRQRRADLLEVFEIAKGLENLRVEEFFIMKASCTKGHQKKICKQRPRLDVRKYWFSHRVVNMWNNLSKQALGSDNLNGFTGHVDKYPRPYWGAYTSQQMIGSPLRRPLLLCDN